MRYFLLARYNLQVAAQNKFVTNTYSAIFLQPVIKMYISTYI